MRRGSGPTASTSPGEACDLDAFRALVERTVDRADYPFANDVVSNVLIYHGDAGAQRRRLAREPHGDDGRMGRGDDRRARNHRLPQDLRRPWADRGRQRPFLGDDRRAAQKQFRPRRPFRQARRERPRVETRWKSSVSPTRPPSPPITAPPSSRSSARPGSDRSTRSPRSSTSSIRAATRRSRTATITWASRQRARSSDFRRTPIGCRRCSPCRARSRIATCRSNPGRRFICRSRRPTCPATLRPCAKNSAPISRSSCRWRSATPPSSIRLCSTRPAPIARRTSSASATCRKSRAPTAARWSVDRLKMSVKLYPAL